MLTTEFAPRRAIAHPGAGPRHRQGGGAGLCLLGQRTGASVREHLLSGVWGVADPALGLERDPVQAEGQEVPPVRSDHPTGDGCCGALEVSRELTCLPLCAKMGISQLAKCCEWLVGAQGKVYSCDVFSIYCYGRED